jgi:plastocyanin
MTTRIAFIALLAVLFVPSALGQAANPQLVATVGTNDAFVITLRDASGNAVTNLAPGTYDIAVSDRSEEHNFHLTGPNVDQTTAIAQKQEVTWTVTFTDGTYRFVCDAHPTEMRGSFIVGSAPPPPAPAPVRLSGTVGPRKTISLRGAAGKLRTIQAGPVVLTVNDRTRVDNFHLTGPRVNRKTGVAFRGRVTWRVTLRPGRYTYRSDKRKTLRGAFRVTPASS